MNKTIRIDEQGGWLIAVSRISACMLSFVLLLNVLANAKDPELGNGIRVAKHGPWTVLEGMEKDSIWVYSKTGDLANLINLKGKPKKGTFTSFDDAGNCLVHRFAEEQYTLLYFDAKGQRQWEKTVDAKNGSFKLSPNGKYFMRAGGFGRDYEVYLTSSPEQKIASNLQFLAPETIYYADFGGDNSILVSTLKALYKIEPTKGAILVSSDTGAANPVNLGYTFSHESAGQFCNAGRTFFVEIVNQGGFGRSSLRIYDQSLQVQRFIEVGKYIQDAQFIDSTLIAFTAKGDKESGFSLYLVRDFQSVELANPESSDMIGTAANDNGILQFYRPAKNGSFLYDLTSRKIIQGDTTKMRFFKKKKSRKSNKVILIGKGRNQ